MANTTSSSLCFLMALLCMFAFSSCEDTTLWTGQKEKSWCVARGDASNDQLQGFLDFCCSKLSCAEINPGGSCYAPDTLQAHASFALDLYFRINGECNLDVGTQTDVDPSHDNCRFL